MKTDERKLNMEARIVRLNGNPLTRVEEQHLSVPANVLPEQVLKALATPGEDTIRAICKAIGSAEVEGEWSEEIIVREIR